MTLGSPRLHFRRTDSTNERARDLAARGAPHGTLVTALEQTAGRGRQGRTWSAPPGQALLCSLLIRDPPRLLPLAAGVAVAETAGPEALLKWPNDVLVGGRKVAGILVEGRTQEQWAVVGIGLNVAVRLDQLPDELRDKAGTLGLPHDLPHGLPHDLPHHLPHDRSTNSIEKVLQALLAALERWLYADPHEVLDAVRARDALRGQPVRWAGGEGVGDGIDDQGRLLVLTDSGRVPLDSGEVHLAQTPAAQSGR